MTHTQNNNYGTNISSKKCEPFFVKMEYYWVIWMLASSGSSVLSWLTYSTVYTTAMAMLVVQIKQTGADYLQ